MNNNKIPSSRRSQLSRQILLQYLLAIFGSCVLFGLLVFVLWQVARSFVWQPWDPVYQLLHWIQDNIILAFFCTLGAIWLLITYLFINRPLRYLDQLIEASKQLATTNEQEILLPKAMKPVQDEMNLIREQALRNASAAREAEQRKNDLIVYLAHDLKTPLTSVIGYLTLLRDEPQISPELRARYTGIALDKAERLEDLINEFFEITRFNLTHLTLELSTVDLTRMLQQTVSEFAPSLAEKNLHCKLDLPPQIPCECDPDKLARVFDNLLRNANFYSFPDTEIHIWGQSAQGLTTLCFENSGPTIPQEKLERIFEQFFRLDSSRSSACGGAGLGLAIAREILRLHGGSICASSAENRIVFTVTLPQKQRPSPPAPARKM